MLPLSRHGRERRVEPGLQLILEVAVAREGHAGATESGAARGRSPRQQLDAGDAVVGRRAQLNGGARHEGEEAAGHIDAVDAGTTGGGGGVEVGVIRAGGEALTMHISQRRAHCREYPSGRAVANHSRRPRTAVPRASDEVEVAS